jgi:hypothetical protein
MKNFGYQAERFRSAVYELMLPHPKGEEDAIARAFHECSLAFQDLDPEDLDESAREWARRLEEFMRADSAVSDHQRIWIAKAGKLSEEQKQELSACIYELNAWFHMYFWSRSEEI